MKKRIFAFIVLAALAMGTVGITAATFNKNDVNGERTPGKRIVSATVIQPDKLQGQPADDEPGIINGARTPELIPDVVAYSLLFRFVSGAQSPEAKKRIKHYVRQAGLGDQTCYLCAKEKKSKVGNDRDIDSFIAVADEFRQRVEVLDQQAIQIRKRNWPNLTPELRAQLTRLQKQKEAIVTDLVASLPTRLSADGVKKVHAHVKERMKPKIKMPVRQDQLNSQAVAKLNSNFPNQERP